MSLCIFFWYHFNFTKSLMRSCAIFYSKFIYPRNDIILGDQFSNNLLYSTANREKHLYTENALVSFYLFQSSIKCEIFLIISISPKNNFYVFKMHFNGNFSFKLLLSGILFYSLDPLKYKNIFSIIYLFIIIFHIFNFLIVIKYSYT